jgi:hypothetical protein
MVIKVLKRIHFLELVVRKRDFPEHHLQFGSKWDSLAFGVAS